ncbi:YfcC family protein [Pseudalkalibacillus sp. A8]|uniref:YfcC family protein n=1 Tax=Pseudalkalibacillus sp. A8 TaxID=3382641 RepID=UPI0038B6A999
MEALKEPIEEKQRGEKETTGINAFVLLFSVIVIAAILTYIVPAGQYERVEQDGREVINPDSFQFVDSNPVNFLGIFKSIHLGMLEGSSIIFFVFIIGGAFGILNATGALDALIVLLTKKLANREKLLIPILMLFFAAGGSLMGMAEETLVYIGILVPLAIALGFDAIIGLSIVSLGASVGFTSAVMNPFTVGVAQGISDLPTFSGIAFRLVLFVVLYSGAVFFVYRYASKVKKDPALRFYGNFKPGEQDKTLKTKTKMETKHKWVLITFLVNFLVLVFGVLKFGWYITEIAGLFLLFGILIGIVGKLSAGTIADSFIKGASSMTGGALIIGVAQAILVIFTTSGLMDTILYYASNAIDQVPGALTAIGMFFLQLCLNFLVPSGSGQAALTMPIMAPLSDLVGVTRQTSVLAYQLGDGISNMVFPTSGFFMAGLALAGIPWGKWIKWVFPFILFQIGVAVVALVVAQAIQYGPF